MDRNPISDLLAAAAMPGLERLADELLVGYKTKRTRRDVVSYLVFLAGRHAFHSANACDSVLLTTPVWDMVRDSAAQVGRVLPESPPTFDKLRHFRDGLPGDAITRLAGVLPEVFIPLAQEAGLVDPKSVQRWDAPEPGNVIYGDGSVFAPLSGVSVDGDGVVRGSRAKGAPRIPQVFEGKDGKNADAGLPMALVGCHGRQRFQRCILGIQMFFDRNEVGASMDIFERVAALAGGGATHVVYDKLLSGVHLTELMRQGLIPVVAMKQARENSAFIALPPELQVRGYASREFREPADEDGGEHAVSGKAKTKKAKVGKVAPKSRLTFNQLYTVEHPAPGGTCVHDLWSLDGAVVSVDPNTEVSLDATVVPCTNVEWERDPNGIHTLTGVFTVPCRHGSIVTRIELSGHHPGRKTNGRRPCMSDWVRPIPEIADAYSRLAGMRSDVESAFSHLKSRFPKHRASSLAPDHFVLDLIGAGLLINAVLWDVHIAGHTDCARNIRRLKVKRALRS